MKSKLLIALSALAAVVCLTLGMSGCVFTPPPEDPVYWDENSKIIDGVVYYYYEETDSYACSNTTDDIGEDVVILSQIEGKPVTSIGESAFYNGAADIKSVTIPDSVTSIGDGAFTWCKKLESITVDENNKNFFSRDGILYNKVTNQFMVIPPSVKGRVTIPDGITSIPYGLFYGCANLEGVIMGMDVTSIEKNAFYGCTSLTSITIPDSVTFIGEYAFSNTAYSGNTDNWINDVLYIGNHLIGAKTTLSGDYEIRQGTVTVSPNAFGICNGLTHISVPQSVVYIGENAFQGCEQLAEVFITDIGAWCNIEFGNVYANPLSYAHNLYSDNNLVTSLDIPQGVNTIKNYAFWECTSFTSVTIPDSVTSICSGAFMGCRSLTGVYITDLKAWCNIEFGSSSANPLDFAHNLYLNDNLVTEITAGMLQGVTEIKAYAFDGCTSLSSVTIGSGVTSIGDWAFDGCSNLSSVTIGNGVTSIGKSAFWACRSLTSVTFENKTGWTVCIQPINTSDSTVKSITVDDPAENATLLTLMYSDYYWQRTDVN